MKRVSASWLAWIVIGIIILAVPLCSSGISFIYHPAAETAADAEEIYDTGWEYRPYREFRFELVLFSGLYLSEEGSDVPTDWIMCGYIDGKFLPFYLKAESAEPPSDQENVSYLLRRPSSINAAHDEWVVASLVDDISDGGSYTVDEASEFFTTAVLQADRNGATILLITAAAGATAIVLGFIFLAYARKAKKKSGSSGTPEISDISDMSGAFDTSDTPSGLSGADTDIREPQEAGARDKSPAER